ncbi:MAG TPA: hypothetical protein VFO41_12765, partial [Alphaproteobacteria bacterium]|nr:hypothetical protein [Alphaproteobacteria bacterium]
DTQPAAIEKFEAEVRDRLADVTDLDGLDDLWRSGVGARLRDVGVVDKSAQMRIVTLFSQKKAEIRKREEADRQAA